MKKKGLPDWMSGLSSCSTGFCCPMFAGASSDIILNTKLVSGKKEQLKCKRFSSKVYFSRQLDIVLCFLHVRNVIDAVAALSKGKKKTLQLRWLTSP